MRKKLPVRTLVLAMVFTVIGLVLLAGYLASQSVPAHYQQALQLDAESHQEASRELESRVSMLYSDARQAGSWQALFTTDQINGWLAYDLINKHRELIPDNINNPRVWITPKMFTLAFQVDDGGFATVFSVGVEAYMSEPNVLALRLRQARAGALPIPLGSVLEQVTTIANNLNLPLRWAEVSGDPVALVTIAPQRDQENRVLSLEKLELHEGEIYLSGRTLEGGTSGVPSAPASPNSELAKLRSSGNAIRQ